MASPGNNNMIMVQSIEHVEVVDSTPLSPGPADGGEGMASTCGPPGGTAVVEIADPTLDSLNVRVSPGGTVLTTIPEGASVTIVGDCSTGGAAGIVAGTQAEDHRLVPDQRAGRRLRFGAVPRLRRGRRPAAQRGRHRRTSPRPRPIRQS